DWSSDVCSSDLGGTNELRNNDALGSIDDESTARGHEREIAHEHRLALNFAGVVVNKFCGYEERRGVGEVLLLAVFDGVFWWLKPVIAKRQRHGLSEVLNGRDLFKDLLQSRGGRNVVTLRFGSRSYASFPALISEQPVEAL